MPARVRQSCHHFVRGSGLELVQSSVGSVDAVFVGRPRIDQCELCIVTIVVVTGQEEEQRGLGQGALRRAELGVT